MQEFPSSGRRVRVCGCAHSKTGADARKTDTDTSYQQVNHDPDKSAGNSEKKPVPITRLADEDECGQLRGDISTTGKEQLFQPGLLASRRLFRRRFSRGRALFRHGLP